MLTTILPPSPASSTVSVVAAARSFLLRVSRLPVIHDFQTDLGLVRIREDKVAHKPIHFLTTTEAARLAGLPDRWSGKGRNGNLLLEAGGYIERTASGRCKPTKLLGHSHGKRIDNAWRWYPSVVAVLKRLDTEHDLSELKLRGSRYAG